MHATITRAQLQTATELLEDSVASVCDAETLSGETAWALVSALATAKLAQLQGLTLD